MNIDEGYLLRVFDHAKELPQTCKRIEQALKADDFAEAGFALAALVAGAQCVDGLMKSIDRENISAPVYSVGDNAA